MREASATPLDSNQMTDDAAAITAERLTRDFGAVRALDGLSFTIPRGQVVLPIVPGFQSFRRERLLLTG